MADLFDFFKEQESKLHERPSEQVWQKLQERMEHNRRKQRRGIRFLQLGTVAMILAILLLAAVLVWYFVHLHPRKQGMLPTDTPIETMRLGADVPSAVPPALRERFTWLIGQWKRREGRIERTLVWQWDENGDLRGRYMEKEAGGRPLRDEYIIAIQNGEIACGRSSGLPPGARLSLQRDDGATFVFMREINDTYHEITVQRVEANVLLLRQVSRNPEFLAPGTQWYFTRMEYPTTMGQWQEQ